MKNIKFILLFLLLNVIDISATEKNYSKLSSKILDEFSNKILKENGLEISFIGGSYTTDVRCILIYYKCKKKLNITEARKLFVQCVEDLISRYNSNKEIRPYLHMYPFTIRNINFGISFDEDINNRVKSPYISLMFSGNDGIRPDFLTFYSTIDGDVVNQKEIYEEPYTESVKIVRESK
jgi:hypothetical protein